MANGGDVIGVLKTPMQRDNTGFKMRDIVTAGIMAETKMHGKLLYHNIPPIQVLKE